MISDTKYRLIPLSGAYIAICFIAKILLIPFKRQVSPSLWQNSHLCSVRWPNIPYKNSEFISLDGYFGCHWRRFLITRLKWMNEVHPFNTLALPIIQQIPSLWWQWYLFILFTSYYQSIKWEKTQNMSSPKAWHHTKNTVGNLWLEVTDCGVFYSDLELTYVAGYLFVEWHPVTILIKWNRGGSSK